MACLPSSAAIPISPRKSSFTTLSFMIFPLSSCSANNVPLNNFDKSSDIDISFIFRFLKKGSTDISLAIDKIGPGIPVPPLKPTVLLDPAISLIR